MGDRQSVELSLGARQDYQDDYNHAATQIQSVYRGNKARAGYGVPPIPASTVVSPEQAALRRQWFEGTWVCTWVNAGKSATMQLTNAFSTTSQVVRWTGPLDGANYSIDCAAYPPIFRWGGDAGGGGDAGTMQWMVLEKSSDNTITWLTSAPNAADRKIVWTRAALPPVPIAQAFAVPQGGAAAAVVAQAVPVQPTAQLVQAAAVPVRPYQAVVQAAVPGQAVASAPPVAAVAAAEP